MQDLILITKKLRSKTTKDVQSYLNKKTTGRRNKQIVLIGYSFGADVLPFILNRLPKNMLDNIVASVIMASSGTTDFEIHWSDIFGGNTKRDMDVLTEINKLPVDNLIIINGSDEHDLALNKISLKKIYARSTSGAGIILTEILKKLPM